MKYNLNFYTQYNQFYIRDKSPSIDSLSHEFWNEEAHEDRLAIENNVLGVRTECYGNVKGEFFFLEKENRNADFSSYDHVVEGGLEITSGFIQLLECPNNSVVLEIPVENGIYVVRIYSSNLSSVDGDDGNDFYKIEIWKNEIKERKLLKRYN
jgi:hypothetical protein